LSACCSEFIPATYFHEKVDKLQFTFALDLQHDSRVGGSAFQTPARKRSSVVIGSH